MVSPGRGRLAGGPSRAIDQDLTRQAGQDRLSVSAKLARQAGRAGLGGSGVLENIEMTSDSQVRSGQLIFSENIGFLTLKVSRVTWLNNKCGQVTHLKCGKTLSRSEVSLGFWVRDEFTISLWLWDGGMVPTVTLYLENS